MVKVCRRTGTPATAGSGFSRRPPVVVVARPHSWARRPPAPRRFDRRRRRGGRRMVDPARSSRPARRACMLVTWSSHRGRRWKRRRTPAAVGRGVLGIRVVVLRALVARCVLAGDRDREPELDHVERVVVAHQLDHDRLVGKPCRVRRASRSGLRRGARRTGRHGRRSRRGSGHARVAGRREHRGRHEQDRQAGAPRGARMPLHGGSPRLSVPHEEWDARSARSVGEIGSPARRGCPAGACGRRALGT
jgi:hypothetical protein